MITISYNGYGFRISFPSRSTYLPCYLNNGPEDTEINVYYRCRCELRPFIKYSIGSVPVKRHGQLYAAKMLILILANKNV